MKDWAQTFWCCGASDGKSLNSPVVPRLERNSARSTAQLRTVWPRGAAKKKKKKKKTDEEENEILEYDSLPVMKNRMSHFWTTRPHAMIITLSLERETLYLRGRFFPLWRKYSFQQQIVFSWLFVISLVSEAKGFPSPFFLFYALVDIVIRFLDTDLSLIICLSVIEVKTEGNRHRD